MAQYKSGVCFIDSECSAQQIAVLVCHNKNTLHILVFTIIILDTETMVFYFSLDTVVYTALACVCVF